MGLGHLDDHLNDSGKLGMLIPGQRHLRCFLIGSSVVVLPWKAVVLGNFNQHGNDNGAKL